MSYSPRCRLVSADELEIVHELAMQIWPKCYRRIVAPDQIDAMASALFDSDRLEADMRERGQCFWLVSLADREVGFLSASLKDGCLHISRLYVLPEYRGCGLGKALIEAAQAHFGPVNQLSVTVNKDYTPAVEFCLRSGFNIAYELPVNLGQYGFIQYEMQKDLRIHAKAG
ncbi:GNAT family N-acetyltransferase [Asticcacaulis sp. EMRT-3]|uniref:GNAT family N-acetyltransferase n=1 Tax=Asticcacaulis sp. EMRT-3 TaxID=3040349 RepID=UPI0024AFC542|nr:GNAT family N-acetyltransferase [Asticcacaulis sp. EMRT-3]MDI7775189.1 GNAT family N-acetyltransferase [Asticcacaulis sp. EMRT-3]